MHYSQKLQSANVVQLKLFKSDNLWFLKTQLDGVFLNTHCDGTILPYHCDNEKAYYTTEEVVRAKKCLRTMRCSLAA